MLRPLIFALALLALPAQAQDTQAPEPPMTLLRMAEIILALDPDATVSPPAFELTIEDVPVLIVTDPQADRMRAMVPIRAADTMSDEDLMRVLQANFDSALDARYAIAQGRLWSVYIHPLSPLKKDQLISGIGQTVNVARTYGSFYSGGAQVYGQGDSPQLHQQLIERLLERGEEL